MEVVLDDGVTVAESAPSKLKPSAAAEKERKSPQKKAKAAPPPKPKPKRTPDVEALFAWRRCCPELRELWPEEDDVETWEGLTFDEEGAAAGRVLHIGLSTKELSGELPPEFGRLDALETLDLESNDITGLPAEIGKLTSLKARQAVLFTAHTRSNARLEASLRPIKKKTRAFLYWVMND